MQKTSRARDFLKTKWVRFFLIFDILLLVVISIVAIYNSLKNSTISFNITPVDATISLNGDSSYSSGTYRVFPGQYDITISHDGLNPKTFSITLDSHSSTEITTFLTSSGSLDFYELKDNFDSFQRLTSIASAGSNQTTDHDTSAEAFITEYSKNIDLYNSFLPYQDISRDKNNAVSTLVTLTPLSGEGNPCSKYLCIDATTIGIEDPNYINSLLQKNGFNLKYLEFSN